jgi:dTMP kinase
MTRAGRTFLIVVEGIDGAGTTTQTARLAAWLAARGYQTHATREPSDGPVGRLLREILAGRHQPVDATTMALLFAADRADHLAREVEPALARGEVVVSDRYYHSSLAYQGAGEERSWIRMLNVRARTPDLTLFIEVPAQVGAARRVAAARPEELYDRLEMQERVAAGYREVMAELAPRERIVTLDGTAAPDAVFAAIVHAVEAIL